jgi:hypothetical protein
VEQRHEDPGFQRGSDIEGRFHRWLLWVGDGRSTVKVVWALVDGVSATAMPVRSLHSDGFLDDSEWIWVSAKTPKEETWLHLEVLTHDHWRTIEVAGDQPAYQRRGHQRGQDEARLAVGREAAQEGERICDWALAELAAAWNIVELTMPYLDFSDLLVRNLPAAKRKLEIGAAVGLVATVPLVYNPATGGLTLDFTAAWTWTKLQVNSTGVGFNGNAAVGKSAAYTVTNGTPLRTINVSTATLTDALNCLAALVADLKTVGLLGWAKSMGVL